MGGIRSNKRSRCSQLGFTLVELTVAIAIAAVMLVGIGAALRAILVSSANSTNHTLAMSEVQKVASCIGDDVVQAQEVDIRDITYVSYPDYFLRLYWDTYPEGGVHSIHTVYYSVGNMTDKLSRNLWRLYRTTDAENLAEKATTVVAEYLDPLLTSCSQKQLGNGTLENVLVLNVASRVDDYSASASYQINPRAFNVAWGAPIYTLTYTAGANGFLLGSTAQTVNPGGDGTTVTAVPDSTDYFFVRWSDGVMTASRTDTNVTHNIWATAVFGSNTYTITASAGSGGNITPSGNVSVNYGATQAFNITANSGYCITVTVDGDSVGNETSYQFTNVTDNHTIAATFVKPTISASASAGGSISPSGNVSVSCGESLTFTITPNAHYHVADVLVDGGSVGNVTSYSFTDLTYNHTIAATFAIDTYTISASAGSGGSITPSGAVAVGYGGNKTFTITPNAHYHVADVLMDGGSLGNVTNYTFTNVTAAHSISASFAINTYTLTYAAGLHGSLTGNTSQTVNYGSSGTAVTAVPATNYHFVNWSDGLTANPRTDTNVTGNISVTANFATNTYTLTYTAGSHGSISGTTPQTVNYGGNGTAVTAVPATGYHFVNWSDGPTANPRTDTNVTGNISVTASFAINTYTLTYAAGLHGSLTGNTSQTVNYGSSGTPVAAVPATGYHFVNWSDSSTSNPRTDTNVTGNISVTANFAINTYTLTYTAGSHGSILGATPQTVNYGGNGTAVTAVGQGSHNFVNWSDGSTANPRTDTNVTVNITVTANFN